VRRSLVAIALAAALSSGVGAANEETLQRSFIEGVQQMQAGNFAQAEALFRRMLQETDSPRIKLELARTLYFQGKYEEAKTLFQDVAAHADTPWRVRDNIARFVRDIEERTGYFKFGVSLVSDSNPRNLSAQREFSIGDLHLTSTETPKRATGLRYFARGWQPVSEPFAIAGYVVASYIDYPGGNLDRLTVDAGLAKDIWGTAVRGKAGMEFATFGDKRLYQFPYAGFESVLSESDSHRLSGDVKAGKVRFPDFTYLDATYWSAALSARRALSQFVAATARVGVEHSAANERPYSYRGWDLAPGVSTFWPDSTFTLGATLGVGARTYADVDPLFGRQRADRKKRLELSIGNKQWRWRNNYISLVTSYEANRSNIAFFEYRKTNIAVIIE